MSMKKLGLMLAGFSGFAVYAQPEIENWLMNQGEYASYWENTGGGPGNPDNFVFSTSTVLANVTRVCYNSTYVWVESDGMTTNMGQFLNPGAPTEQNYTYRFQISSTVLANVTRVCYNSTYVWVESDGMTTNMGQFLNPGAPTEQNYTYRF